jgi:hypothetical protein
VRNVHSAASPARWSSGSSPPHAPAPASWCEAASAGAASMVPTNEILNHKLAAASASLQSYTMATLDAAHGESGGVSLPMPTRASPTRRTPAGPGSSGHMSRALGGDGAEETLSLVGARLPSSNEKLGQMLSDIMR